MRIQVKISFKVLAFNTLVNCDSHWVCIEKGKRNSSSLSRALSIYNLKESSSWKCKKTTYSNVLFSESWQNLDMTCGTYLTLYYWGFGQLNSSEGKLKPCSYNFFYPGYSGFPVFRFYVLKIHPDYL